MIERAPWFDASALRTSLPDGTSRKLGLGSSAAILVASIAATSGERLQRAAGASLADAVFPAAYAAHRKAQPSGSGIDVAASTFGGVITATIRDGGLDVAPHPLPPGTVVEVFASPVSASTGDLIRKVRAFAAVDPPRYRRLLDAAARGAHAAKAAAATPDLVAAISAQLDALAKLGDLAGAGIVTPRPPPCARSPPPRARSSGRAEPAAATSPCTSAAPLERSPPRPRAIPRLQLARPDHRRPRRHVASRATSDPVQKILPEISHDLSRAPTKPGTLYAF